MVGEITDEDRKTTKKKRQKQVKLLQSSATDGIILIHNPTEIESVLVIESGRELQSLNCPIWEL